MWVNALVSAERCGPPLRAVKDGEDLNLVVADAIGNNVRRPGEGELPRRVAPICRGGPFMSASVKRPGQATDRARRRREQHGVSLLETWL